MEEPKAGYGTNSTRKELQQFLDKQVERINQPGFIENDPILIPHHYSNKEDIELAGFWTAMLAWGQRKTIIQKARELFDLMDQSPYDFIKNHKEKDRARFADFKHRTFHFTDTLYFLDRLQTYYRQFGSLEDAFLSDGHFPGVREGLIRFHHWFFDTEFAPQRTKKHLSTPERKSSCKRLNMFLRWMVRRDEKGVDFGIWNRISPAQLMIPLDIHVGRVSRKLGILTRKQNDWMAVEELTENLRKLDPVDPVKYDFALFGLGLGV
jgi:uncharacterized protein (TIGR02757 family)